MKKLIGLFNTKTMSPEQIYETSIKIVQERNRLELVQMAKNRAKETENTYNATNPINLSIIERLSIRLKRLFNK